MPNKHDPFHWARRVSRANVKRLYDSDARGMLDADLLDEVGWGMYVRIIDMYQVSDAINGKVICRGCAALIIAGSEDWPVPDRRKYKTSVLTCPQCGWSVTWGQYFDSYNGKNMKIGSARRVFDAFADAWPKAKSPATKMQLIDVLIHEFHINWGIDGRPVGENVIAGSKKQVIALIHELAHGEGSETHEQWLARLNGAMRVFRQKYSYARTKAIAKELGIQGITKMREDELVAHILRIKPELGEIED